MIPVRGCKGMRVAVLGLGKSGLSASLALRAGRAAVVAWADSPVARAAADAQDMPLRDLSK